MTDRAGGGEATLYCPGCGRALRRLIQHRDYFCHDCHLVVELLDGAFAVLQADLREDEALVTLETLRSPQAPIESSGG